MPAMANISINDGKATPIAHVFAVETSQNGTSPATWYNRIATTIANGWESLSCLVRRSPKGSNGANLVEYVIELPTVELVAGVNTITRTQKVKISFYLSPLGLTAERKDLRTLAYNLLGNSTVQASIDDLQGHF